MEHRSTRSTTEGISTGGHPPRESLPYEAVQGVCRGLSRGGVGEAGGCRVPGSCGGGDGLIYNHGHEGVEVAGRRCAAAWHCCAMVGRVPTPLPTMH